ncbi:hypothetical protein DL768_010100 [Monosporascus sp. mg162]|nr:hypothetical protein DL768_010100 [Monosporascus sp. mg162]
MHYKDPDEYASELAKQGRCYSQRYQQSNNEQDLELAIDHLKEAFKRASDRHPERPKIMHALARRLLEHYQRHPDGLALENAEALGRRALDETGDHDPDRPMMMNGLSFILREKYEVHLDVGNLEEAAQLTKDAINNYPDTTGRRLSFMTGLATTMARLYNATRNEKYLSEAIEWTREAVRMTNDDDPMKPARLCNLGNRLRNLIETTSRDHPQWVLYVNNFCNGLLARYGNEGNPDDVQVAIEKAQDAISQASKTDNLASRSLVLNTLCTAIRVRYRITGALGDLEEAISFADQVIGMMPKEHIEYAAAMQNKSSTLAILFDRRGKVSDLQDAIHYGVKAAENATQKYRQAIVYSNLGILYGTQFEHCGRHIGDLKMAIEHCRKSIELGNTGFGAFANLANWLRSSFEASQDDSPQGLALKQHDLDESIQLAERALKMAKATPAHQDLSMVGLTLAHALETRFRSSCQGYGGKAEDRTRIKEVLRPMLSETNKSPPIDKIKVALRLARIASTEGDWASVCTATSAAVKFLPFLSPQCVSQSDQQHSLSQFPGLASQAAASAMESGRKPYEALQLLEQGRCVISSHRFERRVDISLLRNEYPDLSQKFEHLSYILDSSPPAHIQEHGGGNGLSARHRAETDLSSLIDEIRRKPGFKDFLRPADPCALLRGRRRSAIVVINVSFRSAPMLGVNGLAYVGYQPGRCLACRYMRRDIIKTARYEQL